MKKQQRNLLMHSPKNGYDFLVEIDDHKNITGRSSARTNSRLHNMPRAVNSLSDSYTETTTK